MINLFYGMLVIVGSVTLQARIFCFICGIALCTWTLTKLRNRVLLISICSLFIAVGLGLICFSLMPMLFDRLSYSIGVKYPPLAYVIVAVLLLMAIILLLAVRLSLVDERCRRLAQELALIREENSSVRSERHRGFGLSRDQSS
jgi:hypothetical protein